MISNKPMCKNGTKFGAFCALCPSEKECKMTYDQENKKMFLNKIDTVEENVYIKHVRG